MTAFSLADLRARSAPAQCRCCDLVVLFISSDSLRRYRCQKALPMGDGCPSFSPLPNGREAEPAQTKGA